MTPEQFTYWLQGFVEIRETEKVGLTEREWDIIKDHLKTVFNKVTPYRPHPSDITNVPGKINPFDTGTPPWNNPSTTIC